MTDDRSISAERLRERIAQIREAGERLDKVQYCEGRLLLFLGLPPQTLLMTTSPRLTYKNRMPDWKRERASEMRAAPTRTEDMLWQCLRGHHSDRPRWRSQRTMFGYIVDFWCAQAKLVVEVDGGYHQTEAQRRLDAHRDAAFREHGIRTLRFTNDQVLQQLPIVLAAINQATQPETA